jgi:hypothetical protein
MLKIFAIDFGCYGSAVVAAETREEAFDILKKVEHELGDVVTRVDEIKELEIKKGLLHSNLGDR